MHTTSLTLLERLRKEPDDAAWRRLVELYTPLLFYWARQAGESEHDAADLVQDVFAVLLQELPHFQKREHGQFRNWLRVVALNKLRDRKRRAALVHNVKDFILRAPRAKTHSRALASWRSTQDKI